MAFELINFYEIYIDEIMLLAWKDVNGFVSILKESMEIMVELVMFE